MSKASPASRKKAKKQRRARHKRRMKEAKARRRDEKHRQQSRRAEPETEFSGEPDTSGLSEEEAAQVWGEFFYWEDYFERNPEATIGPPLSDLTVSALQTRETSGRRPRR